jgi:hypothetical protein
MSKMSRYTTQEKAAIAADLLNTFPPKHLREKAHEFQWKNRSMPDAWEERVRLQLDLQRSTDDQASIAAAQAIHRWGFGSDFALLDNDKSCQQAVLVMIKNFSTTCNREVLETSLSTVLSLPDIGIATASKWTCLSDQLRFAIYDSRVSVALRSVCVDEKHRAFPILPRQAGDQRRESKRIAFTANNLEPARMSRAYLDYNDVIRIVALNAGLPTALVEMALFMDGDVWNTSKDTVAPLRRGMWS